MDIEYNATFPPSLAIGKLRKHLAARLPNAMTPSAFLQLDVSRLVQTVKSTAKHRPRAGYGRARLYLRSAAQSSRRGAGRYLERSAGYLTEWRGFFEAHTLLRMAQLVEQALIEKLDKPSDGQAHALLQDTQLQEER